MDTRSKYLYIEPLKNKNKNQGVIGEAIAEFLAGVGHAETVEIAFDNGPVLSASARMAKLIRSKNWLRATLQPGKFYEKSRTALAECTR